MEFPRVEVVPQRGLTRTQLLLLKNKLQASWGSVPDLSHGVGLVLGFGGLPSELEVVARQMSLATVHGVDWVGRSVLNAAKYLHGRHLSPKRFVLHHANMETCETLSEMHRSIFVYGFGCLLYGIQLGLWHKRSANLGAGGHGLYFHGRRMKDFEAPLQGRGEILHFAGMILFRRTGALVSPNLSSNKAA